MALMFDGAGHIAIPEWQPTTADWDIIIDVLLPDELSALASDGIFEGNTDNGGRDYLRIRNLSDQDFQFRTNGGFNYIPIPAGARYERNVYEFQSRVDGSNVERLEVYMQGDPTLLGFSDRQGLSNYTIYAIGTAESRPAAEGSIYYRVQLIDNADANNSRDYRFDDGAGTQLTDYGPGAQHGTLTSFTDVAAAWAGANSPTLAVAADLQPGASFTLNYSNYDAAPVSPVTMTDSAGNSITVPVTISDSVNGTTGKHEGTAAGTMPALPSSGSIAGLKFGTVNVNLSSA